MTLFDIDKNYWKVNSPFMLFFKDIYDNDKSKDKTLSSLKMWCIAFYTESKEENIYNNMTNDEKKRIIVESFLKKMGIKINEPEEVKKVIDWDLDAKYIETYLNIVTPKSKKLLRKWEDKLEERQLFINSQIYDKSTYDMLDDMMTKTAKMWQEYARIKKDIDEEESVQGFAGSEESFLEKRR